MLRVSSSGAGSPATSRRPGKSSTATGGAVLLGDREAGRELARAGGRDVLGRVAAEQPRGGLVGVDRLALVVVDGDRLGERAEHAVQARARGAQVGHEPGVGQHERDAAGEDLEEREVVGVVAASGAWRGRACRSPAAGSATRVRRRRAARACRRARGGGAWPPCSNSRRTRRRARPGRPSRRRRRRARARPRGPSTASSTDSAPDRWPTAASTAIRARCVGGALERPRGEHGEQAAGGDDRDPQQVVGRCRRSRSTSRWRRRARPRRRRRPPWPRAWPATASANGASTNVGREDQTSSAARCRSPRARPAARARAATQRATPGRRAPVRAARRACAVTNHCADPIRAISARGVAQQSFDQDRVLPLAVEPAVAALDADLGEARGAVQREAGVVGGEDAAGELVVAGLLRRLGERVAAGWTPTPRPRACGST